MEYNGKIATGSQFSFCTRLVEISVFLVCSQSIFFFDISLPYTMFMLRGREKYIFAMQLFEVCFFSSVSSFFVFIVSNIWTTMMHVWTKEIIDFLNEDQPWLVLLSNNTVFVCVCVLSENIIIIRFLFSHYYI